MVGLYMAFLYRDLEGFHFGSIEVPGLADD